MAGCSSPGYNDNPSQQITNSRVGCSGASDFLAVYYSVHVQPLIENQEARITRAMFRPYCNELPTPGRVFFTADLVGDEPRRIPIGIRVVERNLAGGDERTAEGFVDQRTVWEVPQKTYGKGVIESSFELRTAGYYSLYLISGQKDTHPEAAKLVIPLNVGVDSGVTLLMIRIVTLFGIASALALVGFFAFRYLRRRMVI